MKIKTNDIKNYECDNCGAIENHIDMHSDDFCYNCIDIGTGKLKFPKENKSGDY